jgi:hypothetical protein
MQDRETEVIQLTTCVGEQTLGNGFQWRMLHEFPSSSVLSLLSGRSCARRADRSMAQFAQQLSQ